MVPAPHGWLKDDKDEEDKEYKRTHGKAYVGRNNFESTLGFKMNRNLWDFDAEGCGDLFMNDTSTNPKYVGKDGYVDEEAGCRDKDWIRTGLEQVVSISTTTGT